MTFVQRWRATLAGVDWARLNHVLIRSSRSRRIPEPSWDRGEGTSGRIFRLFQSLTPAGRSLFVGTLVTAAFAIDVSQTHVYLLLAVLGGALVASIFVSRFLGSQVTQAVVHGPPRVFVGAEATFTIQCTRVESPRPLPLRVEGPFLPYFGRWLRRPGILETDDRATSTTASFAAKFQERGDLTLGRFRVSNLVPLGLASGPPIETMPFRIRIVPRPANVVRIDLPMAAKHQPGGVALASKTGESMDLRGVRPYRKGDRIRDLSARTWARTGKPAVREYQEEYFTRVGVVLDCAGAAGSERARERAFEAAISLTAGIVGRLARGDALVDLLVTGGEVHALTVGRSLGFLEQALDHLAVAELHPNVDRTVVLERLEPFLPRLSAVVMVTDGWDAAREALRRGLEQRGVRVHCVVVGEGGSSVRSIAIETIESGAGIRV